MSFECHEAPGALHINEAEFIAEVIDARTGRPVGGATVQIHGLRDMTTLPDGLVIEISMDAATAQRRGASPPQQTKTGADGAFTFRGLLPGRHGIFARAGGYLVTSLDRHPPPVDEHYPSPAVVVQAGQQLSGLVVLAWKPATLAGEVVDDTGDPAIKVAVAALRETTLGGRRRLEMVARTATDDRGTYRFPELRPGRYVVAVPSTVITVLVMYFGSTFLLGSMIDSISSRRVSRLPTSERSGPKS